MYIIANKSNSFKKELFKLNFIKPLPDRVEQLTKIKLKYGGLSATRTRDQLIKSQLLYHLSYGCKSTPDRIRTCDRPLRRRMLYPAELRVHTFEILSRLK